MKKLSFIVMALLLIITIDISAQNSSNNNQTVKEVKKIERQLRKFKRVPIGSILAFAGPESSIPRNFIVCDGSDVNSRDYPKLAMVLGTNWGGQGTPNIKLPDLRGRFLRGVDDGAGNDPDAMQREDSNGNQVGGRVGSYQKFALKSHSHLTQTGGNFSGGGNRGGIHHHGGNIRQVDLTKLIGVNTENISSESRPVNAAVIFIIRAK